MLDALSWTFRILHRERRWKNGIWNWSRFTGFEVADFDFQGDFWIWCLEVPHQEVQPEEFLLMSNLQELSSHRIQFWKLFPDPTFFTPYSSPFLLPPVTGVLLKHWRGLRPKTSRSFEKLISLAREAKIGAFPHLSPSIKAKRFYLFSFRAFSCIFWAWNLLSLPKLPPRKVTSKMNCLLTSHSRFRKLAGQ